MSKKGKKSRKINLYVVIGERPRPPRTAEAYQNWLGKSGGKNKLKK